MRAHHSPFTMMNTVHSSTIMKVTVIQSKMLMISEALRQIIFKGNGTMALQRLSAFNLKGNNMWRLPPVLGAWPWTDKGKSIFNECV